MSEHKPTPARKHLLKQQKRAARASKRAAILLQQARSAEISRQALSPARIQTWLSRGKPRGKQHNNVFQGLERGRHWLMWPSVFLGCLCFYIIGPFFCTFLGFFAVSGFSFDAYRLSQVPGWLLGTIGVLGIVVGPILLGGLTLFWIPEWSYKYKQTKLHDHGVHATAEIRTIHWKFIHTTRGGGHYSTGHPADVLNIQLDLSWSHPSTASLCSGRVLYEIEDNVDENERHIEDFCITYHAGSQVSVLFLPTKPTYFLPLIPLRPRLYATI